VLIELCCEYIGGRHIGSICERGGHLDCG